MPLLVDRKIETPREWVIYSTFYEINETATEPRFSVRKQNCPWFLMTAWESDGLWRAVTGLKDARVLILGAVRVLPMAGAAGRWIQLRALSGEERPGLAARWAHRSHELFRGERVLAESGGSTRAQEPPQSSGIAGFAGGERAGSPGMRATSGAETVRGQALLGHQWGPAPCQLLDLSLARPALDFQPTGLRGKILCYQVCGDFFIVAINLVNISWW